MTKYRMACVMLVSSVFCLAVAWGIGSMFYTFGSWVTVVLAGQYYAAALAEERGHRPARRR